MQTENDTPKPETELKKETGEGCSEATCSGSYSLRDITDGKPVRVKHCPKCGVAPSNVDDCEEFGNENCPYFGRVGTMRVSYALARCNDADCSASSSPRWRFHKIRNTNGWIGIVDTHHEDSGHIAGWVRPEDAILALAALNHFQPNAKCDGTAGDGTKDHG